jgi:Protein of unknown function (DUF3602)
LAQTLPRSCNPLHVNATASQKLTLMPWRYVDGEIVREGVPGDHDDGAYSTGRGGAANIGSAGLKSQGRHDVEVVPDAATRPSQEYSHYHTGRGGEGNVHLAEQKTPKHPEGLADKLKHKLFKTKPK